MAKGKKRISSQADQSTSGRISSSNDRAFLNDLIQFSLKFYQPDHPLFHCRGRGPEYYGTLLVRLKDLSSSRIDDLTRSKTNQTTRFHRIDFTEARVRMDGFGISQWRDVDEEAWQFSLGVNENGRVHGFLLENVFYIVWLDPDHKLYA